MNFTVPLTCNCTLHVYRPSRSKKITTKQQRKYLQRLKIFFILGAIIEVKGKLTQFKMLHEKKYRFII